MSRLPRCQRIAARAAVCVALLLVSIAVRAADVSKGADVYRSYCMQCHGTNGQPVMPTAPDFTRMQRLLQPDLLLLQTVREGKGAMPGFRGLLTDRAILDVIAYLRTLS